MRIKHSIKQPDHLPRSCRHPPPTSGYFSSEQKKKKKRSSHWGWPQSTPTTKGREIRPPLSPWGWITDHDFPLSLSLFCRRSNSNHRDCQAQHQIWPPPCSQPIAHRLTSSRQRERDYRTSLPVSSCSPMLSLFLRRHLLCRFPS